MALRLALRHTKKHPSVALRVPSLKTLSYRIQTEAPLLLSGRLVENAKRHITTSKPLDSTPTSNRLSSLAPALVEELVEPSSYSIQHIERAPQDMIPRDISIPWTPSVKEHLKLEEAEAKSSEIYNSGHPYYWQKIALWSDASEADFLNYEWQMRNTIFKKEKLNDFLYGVLPNRIPRDPTDVDKRTEHIKTYEDFIQDVKDGMELAPMSVRLTPHILSVIDWSNPLTDPIRRQFIPMKSTLLPDHHKLELDSLHESDDSPVPGLVHRYKNKALFVATSFCPVYCRFCTRSWSIGLDTPSNTKTHFRPTKRRWEAMFSYIENTKSLRDIVVSGGDSYLLAPSQVTQIGERLLSIKHIRKIRFATKGLAVCPSRILDKKDDWTLAVIALSNLGKTVGKEIALHTHFNHPNEITWLTRMATQKLFENGVKVRNQSVLLRGVNDTVEVMGKLIEELSDINVQPYYVYQADMVRGVEDLRTPLQTIIDMERQIRGTIAGFDTPSFVVDLPGGGGKRLAASFDSYDRKTGLSTFVAPAVSKERGGGEARVYEYYDPLWSLKK